MRRLAATGRVTASLTLVLVVTLLYVQFLHVNPTTVALTYLVVVLSVAARWGITESTIASVAAMLCFNFFFLPPVGTLTIADPQNWVALFAFLLTAIVASQLSGRARRRELDASERQRDLERLYALSRGLLLSDHGAAPGKIARQIADAFGLDAVGVYDQRTGTVSWAGGKEFPALDGSLREVARTGASYQEPPGVVITAIKLGGTPIGSVAVTDVALSDTVLQSIANLAAIGLERARADEATARAKAARDSSELRATVLDALAHEFKTPLTSMKAASSDLLARTSSNPRDHELVAIIDEDLDRFQSLVTDAVQMLRIDAGDFVVHLGRHPVAGVIDGIVNKFAARFDGHLVVQRVPPDLSIEVDRDLLGLALRQLLDNAVKYSSPGSTIEVAATGNGAVDLSVRNSGSMIPEAEQRRIFERFYRGANARRIPGTGMGLTIVERIARVHGGTLRVSSSPEAGTTFTLWLPRQAAPPAAQQDRDIEQSRQ